MTNEQQRSPIFRLDKVKKHLYNTIWGIKQLLMMYYSYVEIEYIATSFSPAETNLAVKLLMNSYI